VNFIHLKIYIAKLFQKCVEVPFNLECIDFCNTLIDNNHHLPQYFKDSFMCEQHQRNNDLAFSQKMKNALSFESRNLIIKKLVCQKMEV
jgi:hypothetical protein